MAEIRSRIYHFCKEYEFSYDSRAFFSLTQTCKQIRAEYRPLWLRGSSVTLDFEDLTDYFATFHGQPGTQQVDVHHAPKMMRVLWDHKKEPYNTSDLLLDLKPLLNFRASCKWFTVHLESRQIAEGDYPHGDCDACNQCINCQSRCKLVDWRALLRGHSPTSFEDDIIDYNSDDLEEMFPIWDTCPHDDLLDEAKSEIHAEYSYLNALNCFLSNNNETWLESIRDDDLNHTKIECTMGPKHKYPTIYIRFDRDFIPSIFFIKKSLKFAACQYLTDVGILDLERRKGLDFVVGIGTDKTTRHSADCKISIPTYSQCHIYGHAYKEPAGIVRAARIGDGK
ncbi:hypothetical protein N0V86_009433 [Didymella sp. IMI 355093]|nr:hypothetical protein N0V86_009433 [Didymella sp. IMI 355093]